MTASKPAAPKLTGWSCPPLQEPHAQLPPPPDTISGMYSVYECCDVTPQLRGKLILALFKAGKAKAGAEYQAFQLVLQVAGVQKEVCLVLCMYHSVPHVRGPCCMEGSRVAQT
jgi:hypothetical protein